MSARELKQWVVLSFGAAVWIAKDGLSQEQAFTASTETWHFREQ
jgi:hypothetical protein